jgi:hypothetical protein
MFDADNHRIHDSDSHFNHADFPLSVDGWHNHERLGGLPQDAGVARNSEPLGQFDAAALFLFES